jgi:phage shock protein A
MGIMTRMLRLCKADAHGVMDQLEDKGLLLKQYLREMEASLDRKDRQRQSLLQRLERLDAQVVRHTGETAKLETDLTLAVEKEKDDIARMLIRKRRAIESACSLLNDQIAAATREKNQLSETLADQRLKYETLKARANAYCCRADDGLFASTGPLNCDAPQEHAPADEEIELELIRRKEACRKGATP